MVQNETGLDADAKDPHSTKKTARIAGLLYLLLAITGAYSIIYIPSKIIVPGDVAATANKILANEFLFRTGIISDLISNTIFVVLVLVLYRLFRQVNTNNAKLMVALVIVQIPLRQDLAMLFLSINSYGTIAIEMFWGLWLLPFGLLVYKSGFIPRVFGYLLIIGGAAYIIESLTHILLPDYSAFVSQFTIVLYTIGELSIIFWLLIKGVKAQASTQDDSQPISK